MWIRLGEPANRTQEGTVEIALRKGGTLGIGAIPGRKRKALYRMHGCQIDPIAYFSTDEDAEWVEQFLSQICDLANATSTD
jgi:hypothetical protein